MENQTLQSEILPENGKYPPCSFPPLREKVHDSSIANRVKESKRQAAKLYYRGSGGVFDDR